jgi:hypothetical protein
LTWSVVSRCNAFTRTATTDAHLESDDRASYDVAVAQQFQVLVDGCSTCKSSPRAAFDEQLKHAITKFDGMG